MTGLAFPVVVRHRLHRRRAGRDHQVEVAGRDLARDRDAGGHVALCVEALNGQILAVTESPFAEARQQSFDPFIEHRCVGVLHDGDAGNFAGTTRSASQVREEQGCRRKDDQQDAEEKTFDDTEKDGQRCGLRSA